jgi:hypothetical protein
MSKIILTTKVIHDNDNYTDYLITYYTDNSATVKVYQKNGRTNCYKLVNTVEVPYCIPNNNNS